MHGSADSDSENAHVRFKTQWEHIKARHRGVTL